MKIEDPETGEQFDSEMDALVYWCQYRPGHPDNCSECTLQQVTRKEYDCICSRMAKKYPNELLDIIGFRYTSQTFNEDGFDLLIGGAVHAN